MDECTSSPADSPILKVTPPECYPPEQGRYVRGNDLSPVAVCVILRWPDDQIPPEIEHLVRVGGETGAALAGTLQTENIGLEKMVCNIVANPNIRYLVVCGPESPGHSTGHAVLTLLANGVDENRRIIGCTSPTPFLYNLPDGAIERFRAQVTPIDLIGEGRPEVIRDAVWSCYQEMPTPFGDYELCDPGALPGEPICTSLTWKVAQPWYGPRTETERQQVQKLHDIMDRIRAKQRET